MTDDFKKKLFDYVTGNYTTESGENKIYGREFSNPSSDIYTNLETLTNYEIKGITNDINNNFIVYYGIYESTKGFILISDYDLKTIQLITKYSGGTDLPALYYLNYDEIGNFFGISISSGTKYFLMLNNFCVTLTETYSVNFRQSYALDGILQNCILDYSLEIVKKSNEAKYMFICPYTYTTYINSIIVSTLQINVGSDNAWVHTTYSTNVGTRLSFYGEWQSDNYYYKIAGLSSNKAVIYSGNNGGTISTYTSTNNADTVAILNLSKTYFGELGYDDTYLFNFYKLEDSNEILIKTIIIDRTPTTPYSFQLKRTNEQITFLTNHAIHDFTNYYFNKYGIILDDSVIELYNEDYSEGDIDVNSLYFLLKKQYNLYTYYANYDMLYETTNVFKKFKFIYNPSNYNGLDYQALNSMIPESSILYDETDKIVFARNLYNKTISGGTTTSTLEVPNNYLNDVSISKEELISETNSILNSDTTAITKNIYEQLYINFINTLNVIDNNTATPVLNPTGASRINDSISQTMDYDDTKIVKFVINYSDSTSDIRNSCSKTYSLTENRCTYTCIIYVPLDKSISNIQIKSNDGNTTYLTINTSSLVSGKYYRLSQDLVVE